MNNRTKASVVVIILLILVAVNAMSKNNEPSEVIIDEDPELPSIEEEQIEETLEPEQVPTSWRQFYMGFTPMSYNITLESVELTYSLLENHSDIVVHHFDSGVPWVEAYEGTAYHNKV